MAKVQVGPLKASPPAQVYLDCKWILVLNRIINLYPLSIDPMLVGSGGCPLTFYWTSTSSFCAYFMLLCTIISGSLSGLTCATLSYTTIDYFVTAARIICDVILTIFMVISCMLNTPKVLAVLKDFAALDSQMGVSKEQRLPWKQRKYLIGLAVFFMLNLFWAGAVGVKVGLTTCSLDKLNVIPSFFKFCQLPAFFYGLTLALYVIIQSIVLLFFIYFMLAFCHRLHILQERLQVANDDSAVSEIWGLFEVLRKLLEGIYQSHSPQITLFMFTSFISSLTLLYFAQLSFSKCLYSLALFLLISFTFGFMNVFIVFSNCHCVLAKINQTFDYVNGHEQNGKYSASWNLLNLFKESSSKMKDSVSASSFFSLSRGAFVSFIHSLATYLVIMIQFNQYFISKDESYCSVSK